MNHVATAIALALAIGTAAFITSRARISQGPRRWLSQRTSRAGTWLSELVSCPLCTATWMALIATAIYRPLLVHLAWPVDYLVTALAITAVAMMAVLVIRKAIEP